MIFSLRLALECLAEEVEDGGEDDDDGPSLLPCMSILVSRLPALGHALLLFCRSREQPPGCVEISSNYEKARKFWSFWATPPIGSFAQ